MVHNVKASYDTVTTSNGYHVTCIVKIGGVDSSAKVCDCGGGQEVVVTVEDLGFVGDSSTSHD